MQPWGRSQITQPLVVLLQRQRLGHRAWQLTMSLTLQSNTLLQAIQRLDDPGELQVVVTVTPLA
jgi:hypothetical protein